MILTCPNCETQYFAHDSTIGEAGRTVKCAACDHSWFVGQGEGVAAAAGRGAHEAYRKRVRDRKARASRIAAIVSWAVAACFLIGVLGGAVLMRSRVVEAWPQSASAFTALGMKVNRFGVEFASEDAERFLDGTLPVLEISGEVRNFTKRPRRAPLVEVRLLDDDGVHIATYYAPVSQADIAAGETADFSKRIENPPFEAFQLELGLVDEGEAGLESAQANITPDLGGSP